MNFKKEYFNSITARNRIYNASNCPRNNREYEI